MRTIFKGSAGVLLAMATAAHAQDAPPPLKDPSPPPEATATPFLALTGAITGVTDYRFRGLSQSNKRVALQGTFNLTHKSGFYVGTWASTIDNYVASGANFEVDLYGGYKKTIGGTTIDGGLLYYLYPDTDGATTNFFEPYVNASHTFGPLTAKVGTNFAWKQKALSTGNGSRGAIYAYGELGATIPSTPVTITGHFGRSFKRDYITLGEHYNDWSVTGSVATHGATLSLAYVDTNRDLFSYPTGGGTNRDISDGAVVGSIGFAF